MRADASRCSAQVPLDGQRPARSPALTATIIAAGEAGNWSESGKVAPELVAVEAVRRAPGGVEPVGAEHGVRLVAVCREEVPGQEDELAPGETGQGARGVGQHRDAVAAERALRAVAGRAALRHRPDVLVPAAAR